ncbi:molecular chaperone [Enterobacteriaceae bacterium 89]|nr:molecular chaperone [Enterobacteriaceae bacterium 89]
MFSSRLFIAFVLFGTVLAVSLDAFASAVISGTRIIYPADSQEVSVKITNNGSSAILLQSWLDNGDPEMKPAAISVPFILTPPINRVDAGKGQTLRISFTGPALAADRESVFWLNVLEIPAKNPQKAAENTLQVAFRSRIKLFYRPKGLKGHPAEAVKQLVWRQQSGSVRVDNPTPYFVSLVGVKTADGLPEAAMVAPFGSKTLALKAASGSRLSGAVVNDYGALEPFVADIK